jgi:hypothetical protein
MYEKIFYNSIRLGEQPPENESNNLEYKLQITSREETRLMELEC